jgi:hypothetical protein
VLKVWGVIPMQIKVSTKDGRLFVFEHPDMSKISAFRHLHYEQDEWFIRSRGSSSSRWVTRSSG